MIKRHRFLYVILALQHIRGYANFHSGRKNGSLGRFLLEK